MDSPAESILALMAASIRVAMALLVSLMAASEWRRTRGEIFLHLRTAFLVSCVQQVVVLVHRAADMALSLPPLPFLPILDHALETFFLIALCHAMAAHDE